MNETNIGVREPIAAMNAALSAYMDEADKHGRQVSGTDFGAGFRAALEGGVSPRPDYEQGWNEGFVKGHAMATEIRDIGEALIAARAKFELEGGVEEAEYIDHLRAHLRSVVDAYEALLDDGEFPAPRNRTADEKESIAQWWEDSHNRVKLARAALEHPENAPQHGQRGNK